MNKKKSKAWVYSPHYKDEAEGHIFIDKKDACVITLTGAGSMTQAELDSYGALIAAAPEVFEAAYDALALLVNGPDKCDDDPKRVISALRAAIDKSERRIQ